MVDLSLFCSEYWTGKPISYLKEGNLSILGKKEKTIKVSRARFKNFSDFLCKDAQVRRSLPGSKFQYLLGFNFHFSLGILKQTLGL